MTNKFNELSSKMQKKTIIIVENINIKTIKERRSVY